MLFNFFRQMTEMAGLSKIGLLEDVKNMETEPGRDDRCSYTHNTTMFQHLTIIIIQF